jgi:Caspase domain
MVLLLRSSRRGARVPLTSRSGKDWWDKASIVSSFVSSVVLAVVGLLISYSIQQAQMRSSTENNRAQIAAAEARARENQRLQESQITAQLLQHLVSKNPVQREIAIVALRTAVPRPTYDRVIEILAATDESEAVRKAAIGALGGSSSLTAATTLDSIVRDPKRRLPERQLALKATMEIGVRNVVAGTNSPGATVFALAATGANDVAWSTINEQGRIHGAFTSSLLDALGGDADADGNGVITASEVGQFVSTDVERRNPYQVPVTLRFGLDEIVVSDKGGRSPRYRASHGVFVGTFPRSGSYPPLPDAVADASAVSAALRKIADMNLNVLLAEAATEEAVLKALHQAAAAVGDRDLFVFYFAGHATLGPDGAVRWLMGDSRDTGGLTSREINMALSRIRARHILVIVDSCYAAAIGELPAA